MSKSGAVASPGPHSDSSAGSTRSYPGSYSADLYAAGELDSGNAMQSPPAITRSASMSALFAMQTFCFTFGTTAEVSDLQEAIRAHGGSVNDQRQLTPQTTQVLVNHATDMSVVIQNLQSSENAAMSELIEAALERHTPVLTDTYVWQCIFAKELLDPAGFEVVRLDEMGQYVIPKDRPNLRRVASEPATVEAEMDRPAKRSARPDIRTAVRPSIKRFHTYHAAGTAGEKVEEHHDDEPLVLPRRGSGASVHVPEGNPRSAGTHDSPESDRPGATRVSSVLESSPTSKVYVYASPRSNKILNVKPGFLQPSALKKSVMFSGSDSGSDHQGGSTLTTPRKIPKAPTHNRSLLIEKTPSSPLRHKGPGSDEDNSSDQGKKSSSSEDERKENVFQKSAMRASGKPPSIADRKRAPPPIPARPNLDRRITPLQLRRRNSVGTVAAEELTELPASPVSKERAQWQTMLASVLTGEVIRSEKSRITGTLTQKQQLDQRYQIWLGIRALLRGRSVPEERQRIDERRVDAEGTIDEILKFEVQTDIEKSPYEQVVDVLAKVDRIEMLYPTRKALILDKPLYAGLPFQHKVEALNSWMTVSNSLRSQLQVLKNWVGSEDLLISRSQHPLSPDKRIDTTFIERILKETGVARTFEIQIMSFLRGLLAKCKCSMIENALAFKKMQLPTYINELQQLASFPSNLMEEILKVQLETHTEKLAKHSGVMLDQVIEGFGESLSLSIRIKHECQELDTQAEGWSIANSLSPSYDVILLKSLKCYFTLLNWRLKSTTDTVFFKEAEMLENEWSFMSNICFYIDGGDIETAVQFCELEAELLRKVLVYLDGGMKGVGDLLGPEGSTGGSNLVRWYARVLDNVRSRARKLLRFQKTLTKEFENATEYTISDPSPVLLRNLLHSGYSLVRTDAYANQGLYIFASPSLNNRPDCVTKLLRACFAKYDNFQTSIDNGYILLLSSKDRLRGTAGMTWQGRSMQVRIGKNAPPINLKPDRVRLIADTSERLSLCNAIFEENIHCDVQIVKAHRAHVEPVHRALKKTKRTLVTLSEGIIGSVKKVREALNRVTLGGGSPSGAAGNPWFGVLGSSSLPGSNSSLASTSGATPSTAVNSADAIICAADLVEDMFSFASDFGWRALKYIGNGKKHRRMMRKLVGLAVEWVDFCAADCSMVPLVSMQQKAFKWNLMALEFTMTATSGGRISVLGKKDFDELRKGVARCMRVLIRGFEQGGGTGLAGLGSGNVDEAVHAMLGSGARPPAKPALTVMPDKEPAKVVTTDLAPSPLPRPPPENIISEISALKSESDADSDQEDAADVKNADDGTDGAAVSAEDVSGRPPLNIPLPHSQLAAVAPVLTVTTPGETPKHVISGHFSSERISKIEPPGSFHGLLPDLPGSEEIPDSSVNRRMSTSPTTVDPSAKVPTSNPPKNLPSTSTSPLPGAGQRGNGYYGDTHLQRKQKAWLAAIERLEEDRLSRAQVNRMVGKVLDSRNVVDRNLSFLASTSSSISLRWQQGKFLGGGSFGSVYMAINLETADLMAVKEIRFTDVTSLDSLQRSIKDEMNVLQLLHHPNIIEYYGVEVHRDKLYIFMEYCPHSMANLIEHGGRFGDERVTKVYGKQMLRGLHYLHGKGIVHRDVKPANTLLGQEGQIKYVDFGASKIYKTQKTVVVNGEANTLVGTPHYIAPEVITGEGLGRHGAQDIWSMGCCILEMVTGAKPWSNLDNEWAIMYHIGIADRIPPLPEPSQLSDDGIDFLKQCFTRPAVNRPSAKELLEHPWVKDVDENDLTVPNAIMESFKEASENARARAASANADGSRPSSSIAGHGTGGGSHGSRGSTGQGGGRGGGFEAFEALPAPSAPVFYPARSPGQENPASTAGETISSDVSDSAPSISDGYFPAQTLSPPTASPPVSRSPSTTHKSSLSPSSEEPPHSPGGGTVSRVMGRDSLRGKDNTPTNVISARKGHSRQSSTSFTQTVTPHGVPQNNKSPRTDPSYPHLPVNPLHEASPLAVSDMASRPASRPTHNHTASASSSVSSENSAVVRAIQDGVDPDLPSPALGSGDDTELAWRGALYRAVQDHAEP